MSAEYTTTTTIRAAPEVVWRVLTDAAGYSGWNPEIVGIEGRMALNERIKVRLRTADGTLRSRRRSSPRSL